MAMDGPTEQPQLPSAGPLFGTSHAAGQQAAQKSGSWRLRILNFLRERPATLFEIADHFHVPDHTISGRFTELNKDGLIEPSGDHRPHPVSGCQAIVWRLRGAANEPQPDLGAGLGYPLVLNLGGELYDRQPLLKQESYSGFPYARQTDNGALRVAVRVELVECPQCGKPLKFVLENQIKKFRCGVRECMTTWEVVIGGEPGQPPMLLLVRRTM